MEKSKYTEKVKIKIGIELSASKMRAASRNNRHDN